MRWNAGEVFGVRFEDWVIDANDLHGRVSVRYAATHQSSREMRDSLEGLDLGVNRRRD